MKELIFLKKPENIAKGNIFFHFFELGNNDFMKGINIFIKDQSWKYFHNSD